MLKPLVYKRQGNAPGVVIVSFIFFGRRPYSLLVNMAFGQKSLYFRPYSWGVAPGYGGQGLRPNGSESNRATSSKLASRAWLGYFLGVASQRRLAFSTTVNKTDQKT